LAESDIRGHTNRNGRLALEAAGCRYLEFADRDVAPLRRPEDVVEQTTGDRQVQQVAPGQQLGLDLRTARAVMLEDHIRWIDGSLSVAGRPDGCLIRAHSGHPNLA